MAVILLLVGFVTFFSTPPPSSGCFAYRPWSDDDVAAALSGAVLLSRPQVLAVALVALALALCAGVGGYSAGVRTTSRRPAPPR